MTSSAVRVRPVKNIFISIVLHARKNAFDQKDTCIPSRLKLRNRRDLQSVIGQTQLATTGIRRGRKSFWRRGGRGRSFHGWSRCCRSGGGGSLLLSVPRGGSGVVWLVLVASVPKCR